MEHGSIIDFDSHEVSTPRSFRNDGPSGVVVAMAVVAIVGAIVGGLIVLWAVQVPVA